MTVQRFVLAFAGTMALTGALLGYFVHPAFLLLPGFVGANLIQSAFTGFCPLALLLRATGVPDAAGPAWTKAGCAASRVATGSATPATD